MGSKIGQSGGLAPARIRLAADHRQTLLRQLASMAELELPLHRGLSALNEEVDDPRLWLVVERLRLDLEAGLPLSDALAAFPRAFPELVVEIVRSGESGGSLAAALTHAADLCAVLERAQARLTLVMTYPLLVGLVVLVLVAFVALVVGRMVNDLVDGVLPGYWRGEVEVREQSHLLIPARLLFTAARVGGGWWAGVFILAAGVLVVQFWRVLRRSAGHRPGWTLRLPVAGRVAAEGIQMVSFRVAADLLAAGVPLDRCFELAGHTVGRNPFGAAWRAMAAAVRRGGRFAPVARQARCFRAATLWRLEMAEATGKLTETLGELSRLHERDMEGALSRAQGIIGPILILFLSGIVALTAMAVYLPLFAIERVLAGF